MRHPNVIAAVVASVATVFPAAPRATAQTPLFGALQPTIERACLSCHDADAHKGGVDLQAVLDDATAAAWLLARVRDRVAAGEMPPDDEEPLSAAEREQLLAHCAAELRARVPTLPHAPGRATIRRLSRGQWEHTVADLFSVHSDACAAFPADDLAYGFDSIGDALSFSTLHLEKYLAAARDVAAQVFADPERSRRFEAERLPVTAGPGADQDGELAGLYTNATLTATVRLPRDGVYVLRTAVGADQAGDEPARLELSVDGRVLDRIDVLQREPQPVQVTVPLDGGEHRIGLRFGNDYWDPSHPDPSHRDRNLRIDWLEVDGPTDAAPPVPQQAWLAAADPGGPPAVRFAALATAIVRRTARRPPTAADVERLVLVANAALARGESFAGAARELLTAALAGPGFLFRVEPAAPAAADAAAQLRVPPGLLAVRLSYFLWSSAPDEALLAAAERGELAAGPRLAAEVRRLLADPRADRLATEFAAQWLELRAIEDRTPDPHAFPGFDAALRRSLRRETELLFRAVFRDGRDVRELLDCDFTHLDATLAAFYGVDGAFGTEFVRTVLPPALRERGGVLGHASVHAITANPTRTSPVKRGKWILENLLGQAPPAPPPGSDRLPDERGAATPRGLREQMALHRRDAACAACHQRMDAFGLLLERYDAVGRYREADGDGPIDDRARLPGRGELQGLAGLKAALAADPAFVRTLLRKLFVFAVGRDAAPADRLRLDLEVDALLARGGPVTVADLVLAVVHSDAFLWREPPR